ncbi:MAG: hypothetical protein V3575_01245 [Candidatus Absconditabacteria bacterium]
MKITIDLKDQIDEKMDNQILCELKNILMKGGDPEFVGNMHRVYNIWDSLINDLIITNDDIEFFLKTIISADFLSSICELENSNPQLMNNKFDYIKRRIIDCYFNNSISKAKFQLLEVLKKNCKGGEHFVIKGDKYIFSTKNNYIAPTKYQKSVVLNGFDDKLYLVNDGYTKDLIVDKNGKILFIGNSIEIIGQKYLIIDGKLYNNEGKELLNGMVYGGHIVFGDKYYFLQLSSDNKRYYVDENGLDILNGIKFEKLQGSYFYGGKDYFYGISSNNTYVIVDNQGIIVFEDKDTNIHFNTVCKLPFLQSIIRGNGEYLFMLEHKLLDINLLLGKSGKVGFFYQESKQGLMPLIVYKSSKFKGNRVIDVKGNSLFQNYTDNNPSIESFEVNGMLHLTDIGYLFDVIVVNNGIKFHLIIDSYGNKYFQFKGRIIEVNGIEMSTSGEFYLDAYVEYGNLIYKKTGNLSINLKGGTKKTRNGKSMFYLDFVPINI